MAPKIFFCILFITCYCTVTLAQIPVDCCLQVSKQPVGISAIVDYRQQVAGNGCAIDATILVTRRGRVLCMAVSKPWLKRLKNHVDNLKKECKKAGYQGKQCKGVAIE